MFSGFGVYTVVSVTVIYIGSERPCITLLQALGFVHVAKVVSGLIQDPRSESETAFSECLYEYGSPLWTIIILWLKLGYSCPSVISKSCDNDVR